MFVLGSARLDPEKQLLITGSRTVALQRKPFLVLLFLIQNRHRMILRKELLDHFWDGQEVYDPSLSKAIGSIRKAFGETRDSSAFIETRWGIGYRYVGPFEETSVTTPQPPDEFTPTHPPLRIPATRWISPALVLLSFGAVALLILQPRTQSSSAANPVHASAVAPIRSVAVLPFSPDPSQQQDQYLGIGLAAAVADHLGTVAQLTVRSSSTVLSALGSHPDPASAGPKLKVQAVVAGDLHRSAHSLAITVRLIETSSRANLWSQTFTTDDAHIAATEASIAQRVSTALIPQLADAPAPPSAPPGIVNPQAYSDYMKAEFFVSQRTQPSFLKAIALLHHAIAMDPNYARAYAALAGCYQLQGFYQFAPPSQAYPRAKAAAFKALALDNSLAEAHAALLSIYTDYDWDWQGAEREFKATIAIDPNYAVAYQYYAYALLGMGRGQDGLVTMKHAAELDPVSPSIQTSLAWALFLLRHYNDSAEQCRRVLELHPDFVPAHQLLGLVLGLMHQDQQSLAELYAVRALEPDSSITPALINYELARTGKQAQAAANLNNLFANAHGAGLSDYYLAAAWVAIGDKSQAQLFLNRALKARSNWIIYLQYDPRFDDLRTNPQFQSVLHQVNATAPAAS